MLDAVTPTLDLPNDWPDALQAEFHANTSTGRVGTRLLAETGRVRVWETRLQPGERIAFHRHVLNYAWVALTAGRSRSHTMDGGEGVRERDYIPGDARFFEYPRGDSRYHDLENCGTTELVFAITELLDSANPPLPL